MISYNDFDFAIARWKARAGGAPQPAQPAVSGTVESEVPVATSPESPHEQESGTVTDEAQGTISGTVMSDAVLETPDSMDPYQK
jgi:hypothetical protein